MTYDIALDNSIFVTDTLKAAMQELDLLFNTEPTELIGDTSYGTFFEQFLWDLQPRESDLKDYITRKITNNTYWVNKYDWEVNVTVNDGSETATNIINDISGDLTGIYIVTIDLYAGEESASYRRQKLGTKVVQF